MGTTWESDGSLRLEGAGVGAGVVSVGSWRYCGLGGRIGCIAELRCIGSWAFFRLKNAA